MAEALAGRSLDEVESSGEGREKDEGLSGGCQTRSSSLQFREARHDR